MKMPLLHQLDPVALSGAVEAAAVAICKFNFVSSDGAARVVEGEPCRQEEMCDYCLTQALYVIHHIVERQKEEENAE